MLMTKLLLLLLCSVTSPTYMSVTTVSKCVISSDVTYHGRYVNCHGKGLDEIPQDFPVNTTSIDLSHNNIVNMTLNSFNSLDQLQYLNIEDNRINTLNHDAFAHCKDLKDVRLKNNPISYWENAFDRLTKLHYLSLNGDYSGRIFRYLHNLKKIELLLNVKPIFSGFLYLHKLNYIKITGKDLMFTNQTFTILKDMKIETLLLHCSINHLEVDTFSPLIYLKEISMVATCHGLRRSLASLYGLTGRNMTTIEIKYVRDKSWFQDAERIEDGIVKRENMKYLLQICVERLVLTKNHILFIDTGSMEESVMASCLSHIDLSNNAIGIFMLEPIFQLYKFSNLRFLDLSNQENPRVLTYLTHVSRYSRGSTEYRLIEKLRNIAQNSSPITTTSEGRFRVSVPPYLTLVNFSAITDSFGYVGFPVRFDNASCMSHFDLSYNGFTYLSTFSGLDNLIYMDISGNPELQLSDNFFDHLSSIETLKLNDKSCPERVLNEQGRRFLRSLPRLKYFHISNNHLTSLPKKLFVENPFLQYLNLSNNVFISVPIDPISMPHLLVLDMGSNSIGSLDSATRTKIEKHFEQIKQPFHLSLHDNIIACSCSNFPFLIWLRESSPYILSDNNFSCSTQTDRITYTGETDHNFVQFWIKCAGEISLSVSGFLFTLMVCSILVALLISTNHTKLANFLITVLRYQIARQKREEFRKDVYVSYAEADYQFVCHELCPELEKRNITLYIWDRDSLPGDSIPDQIAENVPNCWKTILYFTANYEADPWSYMSLMAAINCVDSLNPETLILLLPESEHPRIPDCLLEVVPESCIFSVPAYVRRNDPIWHDSLNILRENNNIYVLIIVHYDPDFVSPKRWVNLFSGNEICCSYLTVSSLLVLFVFHYLVFIMSSFLQRHQKRRPLKNENCTTTDSEVRLHSKAIIVVLIGNRFTKCGENCVTKINAVL